MPATKKRLSSVSVAEQRKQFAHAILEARLRESFISVEFREASPLKESVELVEPLHEDTPARIVEAVENLAHKIASVALKSRAKIIVTPISIQSADVKITVLEYVGIK